MSKSPILVAAIAVVVGACSHSVNETLPRVAPAEAVPKPFATSGYLTLHVFSPPPDGNTPTTDLTFANGLLWGTTYGGGSSSNHRCKRGCGTVYWVDPYDPSGPHGYKSLYSFQGAPDGAIPEGGLNPNGGSGYQGSSVGQLYGTTYSGGHDGSNCYAGFGCGTVFSINAEPSPSLVETVLYRFSGSPDGSNPSGGRRYVSGSLQLFYGTTQYGGQYGYGTVYSVSASGQESVVYSFKGGRGDGAYPVGDVATKACLPSACTLYGVTREGGKSNVGTIFQITVPAAIETPLYSFESRYGDEPVGVTLDSKRNTLYGAASRDGLNNRGSIFAFSLSKSKFSVIHSFTGTVGAHDGALPYARPLYYRNVLYGTTQGGGNTSDGTVYRITLSDDSECVIHSFGKQDGQRPDAPLREFDTPSVMLYGTTALGPPLSNYNKGYGTVYRISPNAPCLH